MHLSWDEHLRIICKESGQESKFEQRCDSVIKHHTEGDYAYPPLSNNEKHTIRVMAKSLYSSIKTEIEKSLGLYAKLADAFVIKETNKSNGYLVERKKKLCYVQNTEQGHKS